MLWSTTGGQVPTRSSIRTDKALAGPENDWVRLMIDAWGETGDGSRRPATRGPCRVP